jgi:hypothetical protein
MDLLGFFKERNDFLEIKIRYTLLDRLSHTGSPTDRVWPGFQRPARGWAAIGRRRRSRVEPCSLARCGPACGRDRGALAATDPGGSAVATPACGHRCTTRARDSNCDPRCSMKCPGEGDGGAG